MRERNILPGYALFRSFKVHKIGEVKYINIIKHHNRHVNNTQILSIADIRTPYLETVLMQKIEGTTLGQTFLESKQITIEPSNIKGEFHFLS